MARLVNLYESELRQDLMSSLKTYLAKRGYRADLHIVSSAEHLPGRSYPVEVKYNKDLDYPTEQDLMALTAAHQADYQIDWDTVQVDPEAGIIYLNLEPSLEVIPLSNLKEIPPEFKAIGTGLYKRAADASGNVQQIWELRKDDSGLSLVRRVNDLEVTAEEDQFVAGSIVLTEHGPGKVVRFDEVGNAIVQVGNRKRIVAQQDLQPYDIGKEKGKLLDYFTQLYGKEFAQKLVEDYGDVPRKRP
jgi:hypothetical protein